MKGWHRDNYRHSLAARRIRTSMFARSPMGMPIGMQMDMGVPAGYKVIRHSEKGGKPSPYDPKTVNPKTGEIVDLKKSLQARGFQTTGGRQSGKDELIPRGPPLLMPDGSVTAVPGFGMEGSLSEEDITGIPSFDFPMGGNIGAMPTVPASIGIEQQAQRQVEGGPQLLGSAPLSIPGAGLGASAISARAPKITEKGKSVDNAGMIESGITTKDEFDPTSIDLERH